MSYNELQCLGEELVGRAKLDSHRDTRCYLTPQARLHPHCSVPHRIHGAITRLCHAAITRLCLSLWYSLLSLYTYISIERPLRAGGAQHTTQLALTKMAAIEPLKFTHVVRLGIGVRAELCYPRVGGRSSRSS